MVKKEKIDALVPVEEQPYPVPENWRWAYLGSVCAFIGGGTPDKSVKDYWNGDIPWASVKDIKGDYLYETIDHITNVGVENSATNICDENDLLLVTRIEPGKTIISKTKIAINQDLKIVKSDIQSVFLHHYFKCFQHEFIRKSSGSTVKGITIQNVNNTPIPLPPGEEQLRIINRIESLLTKLDEAKEKAQTVVDGFEDRKAAILHKAFTGELTKKWREENNILFSWDKVTLEDVCEKITCGKTPKEEIQIQGEIPFLKVYNIVDNVVDFTEKKQFIPVSVHSGKLSSSIP